MADPTKGGDFPLIALSPEANTPQEVVRLLLAERVRTGRLSGEVLPEVTRQVWHRERLGTAGIGHGVAIPHARTESVAHQVGIIGRCSRPLDWPRSLDGRPVRTVCLLVAPKNSPHGAWLNLLERLIRQLRNAQFPDDPTARPGVE